MILVHCPSVTLGKSFTLLALASLPIKKEHLFFFLQVYCGIIQNSQYSFRHTADAQEMCRVMGLDVIY